MRTNTPKGAEVNMYVGYYQMLGLSPDLPVWVEADNYTEAVQKLQEGRNRYEATGNGYLMATEPYKIESDNALQTPTFGADPDNRNGFTETTPSKAFLDDIALSRVEGSIYP
jgi:hypothetical protein